MKPGIKTTEFWGKVVLQTILLVNMIADTVVISDELAISIIASIEGLYMVWRQWSKNAELQRQAILERDAIEANPLHKR